MFSINVAPSAAYKLNDWISIAVGLQIEYFKTRLTQALGVLPTSPSATLEGDDTAFGYTAGVTLKPTAWTEVGIGFRSMVHEDVGGSLTTPGRALPINAHINLPETVTAGVRQVINAQWTVLGGLEWTNWSRLGIVPVTFGGLPVNDVPFKYKDGYTASLGVEYAWSPAIILRTGVAYEWSPIDLGNREVLLPDSDRVWASVGATYHFSNKLTFDAGYSHGFLTKAEDPGDAGPSAISDGRPAFLRRGEACAFRHLLGGADLSLGRSDTDDPRSADHSQILSIGRGAACGDAPPPPSIGRLSTPTLAQFPARRDQHAVDQSGGDHRLGAGAARGQRFGNLALG